MGVGVSYWQALNELKELLNQPLPGGRGFQKQRDFRIRSLCKRIGADDLPDR